MYHINRWHKVIAVNNTDYEHLFPQNKCMLHCMGIFISMWFLTDIILVSVCKCFSPFVLTHHSECHLFWSFRNPRKYNLAHVLSWVWLNCVIDVDWQIVTGHWLNKAHSAFILRTNIRPIYIGNDLRGEWESVRQKEMKWDK